MTALKGIVLLLALANVGYFLWAGGIQPPAAVPGAALPATLTLAAEAPHAAASGASANTADSPAAPGNVTHCTSQDLQGEAGRIQRDGKPCPPAAAAQP